MKYKHSELLIAREELYRSKSGFEDKNLAALQGTRELINTRSFRSATKDAINAELSNYNLPLLYSYHDLANGLYNEWDRLMLRFQELVDEHSPAAVIDTSEFSGLKRAVEQPTQEILNLIAHPDLTIAYSAIGGMVGISNPSTADIKSQKEEALQSLRTTESQMEAFNGELLGSGVTTTLSTIASGLSRSRKAVGMTDPYHNVGRAISYSTVATGAGVLTGMAVGAAFAGAPFIVGVGAAVVVGAAVSVGIKALYKNVKPFRDVVDGAGDILNGVGKALSNSLSSMKGAFGW